MHNVKNIFSLQVKLLEGWGLFSLFIFLKHNVKIILPLREKFIKLVFRGFLYFQTSFLAINKLTWERFDPLAIMSIILKKKIVGTCGIVPLLNLPFKSTFEAFFHQHSIGVMHVDGGVVGLALISFINRLIYFAC
jgi:hypothetical protein